MNTIRRVAVVGSRKFTNYAQVCKVLDETLERDDTIVSGGALGVDSMAQRYSKEKGFNLMIFYPRYSLGPGAAFIRNRTIVDNSDLVLAFYSKDAYQSGGTANTAMYARKLGVELKEFEEE
jgi:predicted Rossmann fold nucleotide-binding protein DprA/Smf involved in DNA uptake